MKCSVVMYTRNRAEAVDRTLQSVLCQHPTFDHEVIVVDDGSTDNTRDVCRQHKTQHELRYVHLPNPRGRDRGPAVARNTGYRLARGDVIVTQSADVLHQGEAIQGLVDGLGKNEIVNATVYNARVDRSPDGRLMAQRLSQFTGEKRPVPLFFLGALWRSDLYAVGGIDEDFTELGSEDLWFADCLIRGLGLKSRFLPNVVGFHQDHPRSKETHARTDMNDLWKEKVRMAEAGAIPWQASSGPWVE